MVVFSIIMLVFGVVHPVSSALTTLRPGSHQFPLAHRCRPVVPGPRKCYSLKSVTFCLSRYANVASGFGCICLDDSSNQGKNVSNADEIQILTATVAPCASNSLKILAGQWKLTSPDF